MENVSRICLKKFGTLKESYFYDLLDGEVQNIFYNEFSNNVEERSISVTRRNDRHIRDVIFGSYDRVFRDEVSDMKIFFETVDHDYDPVSVTVISYDNARKKDDDCFYITLPFEEKDIDIAFDKNKVAVYRPDDSFYIYSRTENGDTDYKNINEIIYIMKTGIVTTSFVDNIETIVFFDGSTRRSEFSKVPNVIESLVIRYSTCTELGETYTITTGEYGSISSVKFNDNLYSRYEITEERNRRYIDSVYPLIGSDNVENLNYPFMKLWVHDKFFIKNNKDLYQFTRDIYYINDPIELISQLRKDVDVPRL